MLIRHTNRVTQTIRYISENKRAIFGAFHLRRKENHEKLSDWTIRVISSHHPPS